MTGYTISFHVANQRITASEHRTPVSDTMQYLSAQFEFDAPWDPLVKMGVFIGVRSGMNLSAGKGAHTMCTVKLDKNNCCLFPAEVLSSEYTTLLVGALGYSSNGQSRLTTNTCTVRQEESCFRAHATPQPPAPDLYAEMLETATAAHELAEVLTANAASGAYNGKDGDTPYIGVEGNWHIGALDTGVRAEGRDGAPGATGMLPLIDLNPATQTVQPIPANHMAYITPIITMGFTLGEGVAGYDNEWGLTLTMGDNARPIYLPATRWPLGVAPTLAANTTTIIRWYYVSDTLCGEWVTV